MTRLSQYQRFELENMPVSAPADKTSLRGLIRAEIQAGNIHGVTGTQVVTMGKRECVALLLGEDASAKYPENTGLCIHCSRPRMRHKASGGNCEIPGWREGSASPRWMDDVFTPSANGRSAPPALPQSDAGLSALAARLKPLLGVNGSGDAALEEIKAKALDTLERCLATVNERGREFAEKAKQSRETFEQESGKHLERHRKEMAAHREEFAALKADLLARRPVEITVRRIDAPPVTLGRQHYLLPLLLAVAGARCHAYLVGPAGSGKTSACHAVARALGLEFDSISVCQQSTKTDLLGYMDATGRYVSTAFRRLYEGGGVFVLDEVDNGNANVLAVLNGALANDGMTFGDRRVQRHPDFVLMACGNTYGGGADRLYVGRNQLDAATLDRFCFIDFPYDEGFELALAGSNYPNLSLRLELEEGGVEKDADEWVNFVQRARRAAEKLKLRHVISPRASIYGVRLAAAGIGRAWLERMLVWKGMDAATQQKVRGEMR